MGISPNVGIWDDTACAPPTSAAQVESAMHFPSIVTDIFSVTQADDVKDVYDPFTAHVHYWVSSPGTHKLLAKALWEAPRQSATAVI